MKINKKTQNIIIKQFILTVLLFSFGCSKPHEISNVSLTERYSTFSLETYKMKGDILYEVGQPIPKIYLSDIKECQADYARKYMDRTDDGDLELYSIEKKGKYIIYSFFIPREIGPLVEYVKDTTKDQILFCYITDQI